MPRRSRCPSPPEAHRGRAGAAPRTSRAGHFLAGALAFGIVPCVACGARSWLPEGDNAAADAAPPPPPPPPPADAAACMGTSVPLAPRVPNLYFVLDLSGSMIVDDKWPHVRTAVANLIFQLGSSAYFGATVFPGTSDQCAAGQEVMPLTLGDALGNTQATFLRDTNQAPNGGTPTAATFRALLPRLSHLDTVTYVILATDGGPNCNPDFGACDVDQCTRNTDMLSGCDPAGPVNCCLGTGGASGCLDRQATVDAVRALFDAGVQTYVMGIPGSAPYAPVLDAMATAGGTARSAEPLYYQVDSSDTQALEDALAEIAEQTMRSCTLKLEQAPKDPTKLNVYVGGAVVPSDGSDGWGLDGQTVTLRGATCASVQGGAVVPTLSVVQGCPTVH